MSNIIKKISARAKQIRKAHPSKKWTDCIKQASREIKSGSKPGRTVKKRGTAAKSSSRQTGSSVAKRDKKRVARKPGKRISSTGKVYYERRKNRSDKPGALSGISASTLKSALRVRLEEKLGKSFVQLTKATTKRVKAKIQKAISETRNELKKLK